MSLCNLHTVGHLESDNGTERCEGSRITLSKQSMLYAAVAGPASWRQITCVNHKPLACLHGQ